MRQIWDQNIEWLVCVRCYTYNHGSYIMDAMNGFTMQKTTFPYVCCIVDDASTDREQVVIRNFIEENFNLSDSESSYQKEYDYGTVIFSRHKANPNCYFAVVLLKENHNGTPELKKLKRSYISKWENNCKYEALCEGDDYWTDPLKLQKQVDFLESHPDCSLVCTRYNRYNQDTGELHTNSEESKYQKITFNDLIIHNSIATLTVMVRHRIYQEYRDFIKEAPIWPFGDYPMWLYAVSIGYIMRLPETTAVYRVLEHSASHMTNNLAKLRWAHSEFTMFDYFNERFNIPKPIQKKALFYRCHSFGRLAATTQDPNLIEKISRFYKENQFFIALFSFMLMTKYSVDNPISKITESHFALKAPFEYLRNRIIS